MGEGLFRFVFNTLQPRMAEEGTRFYLPTVLANLTGPGGGKVLPLHSDKWSIGALDGDSSTTISNLFISSFNAEFSREILREPNDFDPHIKLRQFRGIRTPGRTAPNLNVSNATVDGLQNARLEPDLVASPQGNGYAAQVTIAFGRFPNLPAAVVVTGGFQLDQWISIADAKTDAVTTEYHTAPFDWPTFDAIGTGTFQLSVTDLWADVDFTITVDQGQPVIGIDKLVVRGAKDSQPPTLHLDHVKVDDGNKYIKPDVWQRAAELAFDSPEGQRALVTRIQETLNQSGNRDSLAHELTTNLQSVLDRSIGKADESTSVDDNLFSRFRTAVNDPESAYYLPSGVFAVASPSLDPYTPDPISFPVEVLETKTTITLQGCTLVGAANALAPAEDLAFDPGVKAVVHLSTLSDGTKVQVRGPDGHTETRVLRAPLTLTGTMVVQIGDQKPFSGPFTVTVARSTVDVTLPTNGGAHDALDTLTITCTALSVHADMADINIDAKIGDSFQAIINKELNKPENKQQVLDGINEELTEPATLADLGATITTNVRTMLANRLDG